MKEHPPRWAGEATAQRAKVLQAYRRHLSVGTARLAELMRAGVEARSRGPYVWDESGEQYLDCGGYGVFILGHCHPRVVDAVIDQVRTHPTSTYLLLSRIKAEAAEKLASVMPSGLDHIYFAGSGAEAVETALKIARLNGRRRIIAMENGFHGMTLGALSATGYKSHQQPFEPLLPGVEFVPFGSANALAEALNRDPDACVLLEPVQAEAGVIIPPDGYLSEVERICRAQRALLILDEIQTGLGRLGAWWGASREAVTPDLLLVGKALGGGIVPVSAVAGSASAFERLSRDPMIHNSTFSGAPIAAAAAKATIEAIEEEDIVERAALLGARMHEMVASVMKEACPALIRQVRSIGLLTAIEWDADYLALDFLIEMLDRRVILSHSTNAPRVTRLTPPAVISEADISNVEATMRASAKAMAAR